MLVRAFSASAFGLRGGRSDVAQTKVYHAPAPRTDRDISRPTRIPMNNPPAKKRWAPMPPSEVRERTRRKNVRKQGGGGCEPRRDRAPINTRAIPKAPRRAFAAISKLHGDVSFAENTGGLYPSVVLQPPPPASDSWSTKPSRPLQWVPPKLSSY